MVLFVLSSPSGRTVDFAVGDGVVGGHQEAAEGGLAHPDEPVAPAQGNREGGQNEWFC